MHKIVTPIFLSFCLVLAGCDRLSNLILGDQEFISGLNNVSSYEYKNALNGETYTYRSNGRKFNVEMMFIQTQLFFNAVDESKNKVRLDPFGLLDEMNVDTSKYQVILGQHDFDFDGSDELVIAMINPNKAMAINVFKLQNNHWVRVRQNPEIIGEYFQPNAKIVGNSIKINRHLRGFWNIWFLESGQFIGALDVDENYSTSK
jgi:hypothetical protein